MNDYPTTDAIKAVVDALAASDYSDLIPLEFLAPVAQIAVGAAKPEIEGGWRTAVAIDNAVIAELTAELDKVRAQLADTQKRAHTDATNLQQILRDKTALANERDALREQVESFSTLLNQTQDQLGEAREQLFAQKPVMEAAQAWAEMRETDDVTPTEARKLAGALHAAIEQYRLMDMALTSARDEAEVAR